MAMALNTTALMVAVQNHRCYAMVRRHLRLRGPQCITMRGRVPVRASMGLLVAVRGRTVQVTVLGVRGRDCVGVVVAQLCCISVYA